MGSSGPPSAKSVSPAVAPAFAAASPVWDNAFLPASEIPCVTISCPLVIAACSPNPSIFCWVVPLPDNVCIAWAAPNTSPKPGVESPSLPINEPSPSPKPPVGISFETAGGLKASGSTSVSLNTYTWYF